MNARGVNMTANALLKKIEDLEKQIEEAEKIYEKAAEAASNGFGSYTYCFECSENLNKLNRKLKALKEKFK
jgi:archaellum component FlaC